jgi:4-diphosphocytidyl-2-C-methyl-D-erythritol kinase
MIRKAYAKINFNLKILRKKSSRLHSLESFMQLINLCDEIEVKKTEAPGISARNDAALYDEKNLCVKGIKKALEFLSISERSMNFGIEVSLKKNIPTAAGLGGGSADAAVSILETLNICGASLAFEELMALGISVGSDVPFMLAAHKYRNMHACAISGIGDIVTRAEPLPGSVLLHRLNFPVSTKKAYEAWDNHFDASKNNGGENDLEAPIFELYPEIKSAKKLLGQRYPGMLVLMSGSGPSLFVYFPNDEIDRGTIEGNENLIELIL